MKRKLTIESVAVEGEMDQDDEFLGKLWKEMREMVEIVTIEYPELKLTIIADARPEEALDEEPPEEAA